VRGENAYPLFAYLATLAAIVVLSLAAAIVCVLFDGSAADLAKVVVALGFIGAAVTGLIGVLGTFRPKGSPAATTQTGDVNLNAQETGQ
jgi:multisubunit Na+/H+ antiporter MnhC subunit